MNRTIAAFVFVSVLAIVVMIAIALDALNLLILGVVALCLTAVLLLRFSAAPLAVVLKAHGDNQAEANRHAVDVMEHGLIPRRRGIVYDPMPIQIEPPAPQQTAASVPYTVYQFTPGDLRASAINLLLFSIAVNGGNSNQIASNPQCANGKIVGYSAKIWSTVVHEYLEPNFGVYTKGGNPSNGGGTFVGELRTLDALYHAVLLNQAVAALPGVER